MIYFLYILWCGAWNYIRGRGFSDNKYLFFLSKPFCYAYMALPLCYLLDWKAALVVFFGLLAPSWAGWGKAMQAMKGQGNIDKVKEPEFKPIDWIVDKIFGEPVTKQEARENAIFWGNIFGMLYYPMFLYLTFTHNMLYVFSMFCLMLMGNIISLFSEWKWFELTWGCILGVLIGGFL